MKTFSRIAIYSCVLILGIVGPSACALRVIGPEPDLARYDLEVPVELTAFGPASSNGAATTFDSTSIAIDSGDYDGAVTAFFEIVGLNNSVSLPYTVSLVTASGATPATVVIPENTGANTRIRSSAFSLVPGAQIYKLRLPQTSVNNEIRVPSARILIQQKGATRTRIYIPLASRSVTASNMADLAVDTTTSMTFTQGTPSYFIPWMKDTASLSTIPAGGLSFEAVGKVSAADTAEFTLYNETETSPVAASTVSTTQTALTLLASSFDPSAAHFNEGDRMVVMLRSLGGGTATLYKAGLWVKLNPIVKSESYYQVARYYQITANALNVWGRQRLDTTLFSRPSVYFRMAGFKSGGTQLVGLASTSTDSGGSQVAVPGTDYTFMTAAAPEIFESQALAITSGERFMAGAVWTSGTAYIVGAFVIIRNE